LFVAAASVVIIIIVAASVGAVILAIGLCFVRR